MRASIAYFAGAGTVVAAIAIGVTGGVVIGNIVSPSGTRALNKLEQRAATQQAQPSPQASPSINTTASAPQAPVPYLATQAATTPAAVAPAPSSSPQPATASNDAAPPAARTDTARRDTDTAASTDAAAKPAQAVAPPPPQQASRDQAPGPDNAYARARDADLKRADDKRRAEYREQWLARRQHHDQDEQDADDRERGDNEGWGDDRRWGDHRGWHHDRWRDSGSREIIVRREDRDDSDRPRFGPPTPFGFPRFKLFGPDRD